MRILILLIFVAVALPATVDAGPRPSADAAVQKRGRAHFERGKDLANRGRYTEALVELTQGYELTGRPLFLFNMAECARALSDVVQARELYTRYLAAEANGPFANAARARLVELTPPPAATEPAPAPAAPPAPQVVLAPLRDTAASAERPAMNLTAPMPAKRSESHTVRNVLLVSVGLAVVAGSVAIYVGTRGPDCGRGCVDLR